MKKQRLYLDTSVFGGLYDEEFQEITKPLFERIEKSEFEIIFSELILLVGVFWELSSTPPKIAEGWQEVQSILLKNSPIVILEEKPVYLLESENTS